MFCKPGMYLVYAEHPFYYNHHCPGEGGLNMEVASLERLKMNGMVSLGLGQVASIEKVALLSEIDLIKQVLLHHLQS